MAVKAAFSAAALALCLSLPAPALADVKAGVDAWSRGDYTAAVSEWRGPAAQGDADAQFNMAQAFRLGRGVEANSKQAEVYYAKAAAQGHLKAADNLGLLMFQDGRRQQAMPYVQAAAERGDPRAQYLLGIAHFNGDLVEKDWVRAYALLTLANSAGLPQATPAIAQMDDFIPLAQREQAQIVAVQLKRDADAQRVSQLAAADLGTGAATSVAPPPVRTAPVAPVRQNPGGAAAIPRAIPTTSVAPSVAAAQAAVAEAQRVTGTESPAQAGASYARPVSGPPVRTASAAPGSVPAPAPAPVRAPAPQPTRASATTPAPAPASAPAATASGPWKVQLGAFSVKSNADRLWSRLASRSELSGSSKLLVPSGRVTRLLAAGFASRSDAQTACSALKRRGQDCLVTR